MRSGYGTVGRPLTGVSEIGGQADHRPLTRGPSGERVAEIVRQRTRDINGGDRGANRRGALQKKFWLWGPPIGEGVVELARSVVKRCDRVAGAERRLLERARGRGSCSTPDCKCV